MAKFRKNDQGAWLLGETLVSPDRTCISLSQDTTDLSGNRYRRGQTFQLKGLDTAVVVAPYDLSKAKGTPPVRRPWPHQPLAQLRFPLDTDWEFVAYL